jgi:cytochrome P450
MPKDQTLPELPVRVPLVTEPWGMFKTLSVARRNLLEILPELATQQPIVTGKTGKTWHMVMDPDGLKQVLKDRLDIYPKSIVTKRILKPGIGDSMFIAEGAHWRWQRQAATPVFKYRNIADLAPVMSAATQTSCDRLTALSGTTVDLNAEMVSATFEIISNVTFSGTDAMDRATVGRAIERYMHSVGKLSLMDLFALPAWIPRPHSFFGPTPLGDMRLLADKAIESRRANGPKPVPDLLDLILDATDPETGQTMNSAEVRDNLLAFIVAGHETTALALSWALYLCAFDPAVQDRARAEAQSVLQGRIAGADDVPHLPYTRQIIDEALRLYPPAAILGRSAMANDTLCGRTIRKGDTVMLPIYALHRHKMQWENPDAFDPDRFAPGQKPTRYSYLPFGEGPRICIGAAFALMEAVIILGTLLSRFKFERIPGIDPKPVLLITLRPEGGVRLRVEAVS